MSRGVGGWVGEYRWVGSTQSGIITMSRSLVGHLGLQSVSLYVRSIQSMKLYHGLDKIKVTVVGRNHKWLVGVITCQMSSSLIGFIL